MRKKTAIVGFGLIAFSVLASGVAEAAGEGSFFLGRLYSGDFLLADRTAVGGTIGAFAGPIGFEFGVDYAPTAEFQVGPRGLGASLLNLMGNVVVQIPIGRFVPYGTVGYGALIASADNAPPGAEDFLGTFGALNYGLGGKIFVSDRVGVRVDYRRFAVQSDRDEPRLHIPLTDTRIDGDPDLDRLTAAVIFRW